MQWQTFKDFTHGVTQSDVYFNEIILASVVRMILKGAKNLNGKSVGKLLFYSGET